MKYCGECGSKLSDEALFCAECGNRVAQDISNENPARNADAYIPNHIPPAQGYTQKPKPSLILVIGYIVSALLILAGAAFMISSFFN